MPRNDLARTTALAQGVYYLTTGVWPIVSIRAFEAVTGPKVDRWLVKTFGGLIGTLGGVLVVSGRRAAGPSADLAAVAAAALAVADVVYTAKRRISPVYLLDAVAGAAIVAGWALAGRQDRRAANSPGLSA